MLNSFVALLIAIPVWLSEQFDAWIKRREEERQYIREKERLQYEEERQLQLDTLRCMSCESLRAQVASQQDIIKRLLEKQLEKPQEVHATNQNIPMTRPHFFTGQHMRQKLEAESRTIAKKLSEDKQREIDELEREVVSPKEVTG